MKKIDVKRIKNPKLIIKDLTETIRPSLKEPMLEFIILGHGKNLHQTEPFSKDAQYVSESTGNIYEIEEENLMLKRPFWGRKKLVAIFHADGTPVKIEGGKEEISAESLFLADQSRSLKHGLESVFTKHFDLKKIMFFVIIGVIAVVVIMVLTGGIRI